MNRLICFFLIVFFTQTATASLSDCLGVYVGQIVSSKGTGVTRFTVVENQSDLTGSQWIYFTGWTHEEKQSAMSVLLSAKMANKKISISTEDVSNCNITASSQVLSYVILQAGQ